MNQAALAIWHREFNDTAEEIYRVFRFGQRDYAGKAKLEIGTKLLEDVIAAGGVIMDEDVNDHSWRWLYHTSSIQAVVDKAPLNVWLGAKHRRKPTTGLPYVGISSELVVYLHTIHPELWCHPLVQQMKSYLTEYEPQFVAEMSERAVASTTFK